MAAHRYWRLTVTAVDGGTSVHIGEIEMRTTPGGPDVCSGGTASASASLAGTSPAGAFDNHLYTRWGMNVGAPWIQYDFGAGNAQDIVEFCIIPGSLLTQAPRNFTFAYSDDGSSFTTWGTYTNITGWGYGQRRTFNASGETATPAVPSAARYWRIFLTAVDGGTSPSLAELEFRLTAGGADQTGAGTAGPAGGWTTNPTNAFDDNSATVWATNVGTLDVRNAFVMYDFGAGVTKAITEVGIQANGSTPNQSPKDFLIQRSMDGLGWETSMTLTGITGWTAGQVRYFDATGEVSGSPAASVRPVVFICT